MKFTKMQGLGNDYVYINGFEERVEDPSELSKKISDRHFGVGSDGLILINPSKRADFEMAMYNADGSRGEMCGNGIRCVGKYVYDKGLTDKTHITVETLAGVKSLDLTVRDGKVRLVRVDMGGPILTPKLIPVKYEGESVIDEPITVLGVTYRMTCVCTGPPHTVVFTDDPMGLDLEKIGPAFEHHELFPRRTNVEFVKVLDKKTLFMRVWERGSGETYACGTGACASAVAAALNGLAEDEVTVKMRGGDLAVQWDKTGNKIYMTGEAQAVFEGEWE